MNERGFIKNSKLLEETPNVPDLMEWSNLKDPFKEKVKSIKNSSIIGIVGPFGSGKSTMLDKIRKEIANNKNFWFDFEAWKYPERDNLWENFIYDLTKTSGVIKEEDIRKIINGELKGLKKLVRDSIEITTSICKIDYIGKFFTSYIKETPVTRVNDYQKLLDTIIKKLDKPIYITIEDIDRSSDKGLYFLETLKNYIEKTSFKKKFLVFVPISTNSYNEEIDRYLKVIDYFEFFKPSYINFLTFVDKILRDDLRTTNDHLLLANFFSQYFHQNPDTTLRKLKLMIRQANVVYTNQINDGKNPDWRLTLCAEIMKFTSTNNQKGISYYESVSIHKGLAENNIFSAYIEAIRTNRNTILDSEKNFIQPYYNILTILKNPNEKKDGYISVPWIGQRTGSRTEKDAIFIEDFYFKYN